MDFSGNLQVPACPGPHQSRVRLGSAPVPAHRIAPSLTHENHDSPVHTAPLAQAQRLGLNTLLHPHRRFRRVRASERLVCRKALQPVGEEFRQAPEGPGTQATPTLY